MQTYKTTCSSKVHNNKLNDKKYYLQAYEQLEWNCIILTWNQSMSAVTKTCLFVLSVMCKWVTGGSGGYRPGSSAALAGTAAGWSACGLARAENRGEVRQWPQGIVLCPPPLWQSLVSPPLHVVASIAKMCGWYWYSCSSSWWLHLSTQTRRSCRGRQTGRRASCSAVTQQHVTQ